uniref:Cysteine-serine-rich nuclear protein 3 n=1 Tax=Nothobranchius korthausae TaxID=1143690 RepID=A0A1A8HAD6_9TELE
MDGLGDEVAAAGGMLLLVLALILAWLSTHVADRGDHILGTILTVGAHASLIGLGGHDNYSVGPAGADAPEQQTPPPSQENKPDDSEPETERGEGEGTGEGAGAEGVWTDLLLDIQSKKPQAGRLHASDGEEDERDDEEEDDDDEEEEDEEDEEEENEEDEEDSSSVCSGLSDSSTQSLANSDSEDEEGQDEGAEKSESFEDDIIPPAVSHTEVVPLSSAMCYNDNHINGNPYLMNSTSADYYQLGGSSADSNGQTSQPSESYGEALPFQDLVSNENAAQGPFSMAAEPYTSYSNQAEEQYTAGHPFTLNGGAPPSPLSCYTPDQNKVRPKAAFVEQSESQTQFQNFLNNNSQSSYSNHSACTTADQPPEEASANGHSDLTLLANTKILPLPDHCPEVAAI